MSEQRVRFAALGLAGLGVAIAGYLTWVHYEGLETLCLGGGGGCERVQSSTYAEVAGVPVALFGLLGYAAMLGLLWVGERALLAAAATAIAMLAFSLYLTYLELFVIDAICQWCVASAVVCAAMTACVIRLALRAPEG